MKTRTLPHHSQLLVATALAMLLSLPLAVAGDASAPLPPGIVEFVGRLARNHSYLFDPEKRDDLHTLNRELRDSQRELDKARADDVRQACAGNVCRCGAQLHVLDAALQAAGVAATRKTEVMDYA